MKILIASSEVHPYSKTGGLADMVSALAKYLALAGHEVGVVTPLYAGIQQDFPKLRPFDWHMNLPLAHRNVPAEVSLLKPAPRLTYYFVRQPEFYERNGLYGNKAGDHPDNAERFLFLCKAVVHLARYLPWKPEIVHCHDWQTAFVPLFVQHQRWREGWTTAPRTCLTIHNLGYQGIFSPDHYRFTNLPWDYYHTGGVEFFGDLNFLKTGLYYADRLTTVSPTYAREITTPELGCRLEGVLLQRQAALTGILNGVDYTEWKTTGNPHLAYSFQAGRMEGKLTAKKQLQGELGLPVQPTLPLFGNIGRLAHQKGIDILLGALEEMAAEPLQFVALGTGEVPFETALRDLAARYPERVAVRIAYNTPLAHRIEAGCDFFVMPSRYEPCGLNQMYSLRYGTIPIVRATGGLEDSVVDITEALDRANGIKLDEHSVEALVKAMRKALALYRTPPLLEYYRNNAMKASFSWEKTAGEYVKVYQQMVTP